eukprot:gene4862-9690_t
MLSSKLEFHTIFGKGIHIKRDDMLNINNLSGNKARKFLEFSQMNPFPSIIASYGGHQSNAMLAIAKVVNSHPNSKFLYYTKKIPNFLKSSTSGSLSSSLALGMQLSVGDVFWIPQGGAFAHAELGVAKLAQEILQDVSSSYSSSSSSLKWKIIVASGTGTTAFFLARHLQQQQQQQEQQFSSESMNMISTSNNNNYSSSNRCHIEVIAVPCVGSDVFLKEQMELLDEVSGQRQIFPKILSPKKQRNFAEPCVSHLEIWSKLTETTGVTFDLVYAPRTWEILLDSWEDDPSMWDGVNIMYIHCGGQEGNESQLGRYRYAVPDAEKARTPGGDRYYLIDTQALNETNNMASDVCFQAKFSSLIRPAANHQKVCTLANRSAP